MMIRDSDLFKICSYQRWLIFLKKKVAVPIFLLLMCLVSGSPDIIKHYTGCFAPPLPGLDIGPCPKEHVHRIPDINFLRTTGLSEKAIQATIGATGTKTIAVILVNFNSAGSNTSGSYTMSGDEIRNVSITMEKLRNYYLEVSGSSLTLVPTYVYTTGTLTYPLALTGSETPFNMGNSMATYGADSGGNIDFNLSALFRDAVNASGIFKNDYDCLAIVHAGYGEESTGQSGDIWSQFVTISSAINGFTEALFMPVKEISNVDVLGVFCHEFGHQLGLPDLYNASTGKSVVGSWCLMDYGVWLGSPQGSKPAHPSVWCKKQLGWLTPTTASGTQTLTLRNIEQNKTGSSYKFSILNSSTEYFLIEYRKKHLYDESLPGEGVLIWHIDESVASTTNINSNNVNTDTSHPGVRLIEKDKDDKLIETSTNKSDKGSSTDPFRSSSDMFGMPQSNSYNGSTTGITLANFSGVSGLSMSTDSYVIAATTDLQSKKVFGFPNPSKDGSPVRIRSVFSRPISEGNIKIYNIAGELVKESTISNNNITISASKDYEWVYEYLWDLTNAYGNNVSTGVYVYVVEAYINDTDKQVKIGKLAIIK